MTGLTKTERGFHIFGDVASLYGKILRVQESSMAFKGAHVFLFYPELEGMPGEQFSVAQAKEVIAALQTFVDMAENDELTEPAVWTKETAEKRGYGWEDEDDG